MKFKLPKDMEEEGKAGVAQGTEGSENEERLIRQHQVLVLQNEWIL